MNAREMALAAHEARAVAAPVEERETYEETMDRERRERWERVQELLPQSPITEWFPDVEWEVLDFGRPGTSSQYQGDGREFYVATRDRDFTLWCGKSYLTDEWEVQLVWRHKATGYYEWEGTYWTGVEVKSAADVGEQITKMNIEGSYDER